MTIYYRSYRIVNGKAKWIIIDEDYNKIPNPTAGLMLYLKDKKFINIEYVKTWLVTLQ